MNTPYKKTRNYLHYTLGYPIHVVNKIMKRFAPAVSLEEAGAVIQDNWDDFMDFYGSVKDEYKHKRKNFAK